ncbi:TetR/AcrR family transcriptional regulator [Nocardioides marmorisolisilvae]|uniref:TetR/AcrR family transcriptional regulator n=1 Tax=Nocardioides marmorisolisilvae TaxID=1542737 RepID=A0A3N0DW83_9ACTN|nr:TetR/AcrR family transcriptional regulator [Nocardioides marmorisolisilvae]RNL79864.1 TetR/AcrR family transcriptional regulator [Nocardioides marmorisolisilvae]
MAEQRRVYASGDRVGATVRSGTRRRSAERLSVDRIVAVAIDQMRTHGYDAVTMRSIARELGTGPASLYAHVANRAELDQLVVGRVCALWEIPDPDPERWDAQLRECLISLLGILRAHPGVARCTMGMIPVERGMLAVVERLIGLLKAGEVPDQYIAWFVDVSSLFVGSVAAEEDIWRERMADIGEAPSEEETVVEVREVFSELPVAEFPLLSGMAEAMTTGTGDERFEFGVDVLISGLKALSAAR